MPAWGVARCCTRSVPIRDIITPTLATACRLASSHPSASPWGGIEEGDEVSPWVSHVSWHMMMFSFPLIRQRPCMHPCLAPVPHLLLYLTSFEIHSWLTVVVVSVSSVFSASYPVASAWCQGRATSLNVDVGHRQPPYGSSHPIRDHRAGHCLAQ